MADNGCCVNLETLQVKGLGDVRYKNIHPIRLHMELECDDRNQEIEDVLQRLGGVKYGNTISRDVIVPDDMQLWALHYMLQQCFGWENSHLHHFSLPEDTLKKITGGVLGKHARLTGVVFRCLWMDENAPFWNDDYDEVMDFNAWLRSKYTGPYVSKCKEEGIVQSKLALERLRTIYSQIEVEYEKREDFEWYSFPDVISAKEYVQKKDPGEQWFETEEFGVKHRVCRKVFAFDDIPLQVMRNLDCFDANELLERLCIKDVLAVHQGWLDSPIREELPECFEDIMTLDMQKDISRCLDKNSIRVQPSVHPLTDTLHYVYDYGDGWKVKITACTSVTDLLEGGRLTMEELEEAVQTLHMEYRPVCIGQDGYNVMDGVGGIGGFIRFLRSVKREEDEHTDEKLYGEYEDRADALAWAKMMGWSMRPKKNKNVL